MGRKKSTKKVPKEFDISKYDACENFGSVEWYTNLAHRGLWQQIMHNYQGGHSDALRQSITRLLSTPLDADPKIGEWDDFRSRVLSTQVRPMSALDYLSGKLNLPPEWSGDYLEVLSAWESSIKSDGVVGGGVAAPELLDVPAWQMLEDCGVNTFGEVPVTVNLYASEEQLVDDFREFLRETRAAMGIPNLQKRFNQSDFDGWHEFRILAYLDLTAWAEIHGASISQQEMGFALFPGEYDVSLADRVRKVVKPLALAAVALPSINALHSQAREEAERKTGISVPEQKSV
ncbi:DUF6387 family protein [Ralstonia sp. 24A2]|uniref:DUF6387 family protein n=1 Tax=Ralstonia sp. 24A2 TaxID=3447364 RepID=UPI003F69C4F3